MNRGLDEQLLRDLYAECPKGDWVRQQIFRRTGRKWSRSWVFQTLKDLGIMPADIKRGRRPTLSDAELIRLVGEEGLSVATVVAIHQLDLRGTQRRIAKLRKAGKIQRPPPSVQAAGVVVAVSPTELFGRENEAEI